MVWALRAVTAAVLVGCLSLSLELLGALRLRLDLSSDQRSTPDPQLTALLMGLSEPVVLEALLPLSAPAPHGERARALFTLLKELEAQVSSRRLSLQITDSASAQSAQEVTRMRAYAQRLGLPLQLIQGREGGRLIRLEVPHGLKLSWLNQSRVLTFHKGAADREGALLQALSQLTSGRAPLRVGVSTGHGEPELIQSPLARSLAEPGMLKEVQLEGPSLVGELDVLLILGARRPFGDRARYQLDQLLCAGGSVVIAYDLEVGRGERPEASGLEPLLEALGVQLSWAEVLIDQAHPGPAVVSGAGSALEVRAHDPRSPWVRSSEHPISAPLARLVSPESSPLTLSGEAEPLLVSYPSAARWPRGGAREVSAASGALPLAAVVEGRFKSLYERGPSARSPEVNTRVCSQPKGEGRLVVLPSGRRLLSADRRGLELIKRAALWARRRPLLARAPRELGASLETLRAPVTSLRWWGTLAPLCLLTLMGLARRSAYLRQRASSVSAPQARRPSC